MQINLSNISNEFASPVIKGFEYMVGKEENTYEKVKDHYIILALPICFLESIFHMGWRTLLVDL